MRKIRLLIDVPVGRRHGLTKGREMDVARDECGGAGVFVHGDTGDEIGLFPFEFEDVLGLEPSNPPLGGWWTPICEIDGVETGVY